MYDKLKNPGARDLATVAAEAKAEAEERARSSQKQLSMQQFVVKTSRNKEAAEFDVRLLLFLVRCAVPFETISTPEFRCLMRGRDTSLRSPDYMLQVVLPGVASFIEAEIRRPLKTASSVAVVMDGWELKRKGVLGVVGHWIMDDWRLRTDIIGMLRTPNYQSGVNLSAVVTARLNSTLGSNTTISACITDNDAKYQKVRWTGS